MHIKYRKTATERAKHTYTYTLLDGHIDSCGCYSFRDHPNILHANRDNQKWNNFPMYIGKSPLKNPPKTLMPSVPCDERQTHAHKMT